MKFSVVGFVKDASGVAGLYLGKQEGKDLVYHRQGWHRLSRTVSSQIRKNLNTVIIPKSKLTKPHGLSQPSSLKSSIAISRLKGCCGKAPSRDCPKGTSPSGMNWSNGPFRLDLASD